jgi:hypothetical protein
MEEVKEWKDACNGDLVEYKNKCYRVVGVEFDCGGNIKLLKIVKENPMFSFTRVITVGC